MLLVTLQPLTAVARTTRLRPIPASDKQAVAAATPVQSAPAAEKSAEPAQSYDAKGGVANPNLSEVSTMPLGLYDDGQASKVGRVNTPAAGPSTTLPTEVEPNGTAGSATPVSGTQARVRGDVYPAADVDYYSFTAAAGDKVYAATMTAFSGGLSGSPTVTADSVLDLLASDGTTVLETDDQNGTFDGNSSSIAGSPIATAGTYYLRVKHFTATGTIRPYDLYFRLQSGSPAAEAEPNDTTATAQALPASGWVSGATSGTTDADFYSIALNAGDTVYLSLDLDPERDTTTWNGSLGFGAFGTPALNLLASDSGSEAGADSEAFFFTVKTAGTYFASALVPAGGTTFGTYHLSATVFPATTPPGACATYASTDVPKTIPADPPSTTMSTITVPGNPRVSHLRVNINATHTFIADLDVQLTAPNGTTIGLFSDIGPASVGGTQTTLDVSLDDDFAIPVSSFALSQNFAVSPEFAYRLGWLNGVDAGGTWTLTIRDDATGDAGTLNSWSLEICDDTTPFCTGGTLNSIFSADFEANDGGFTHTGTADEWEYGTPVGSATNPIGTANSGTKAWKTDLDNTYDVNSNQELSSPQIVLPATGTLRLSWAQKYQMDTANNDHAYVEIREVGGASAVRRLFEHLAGLMTDSVGNSPVVVVQEASGWSLCRRDISDFAGKTVQIVWHLDSNAATNASGFAVDDVTVEQCAAAPTADLATTLVDTPDPVNAGSDLTYTLTATNNGPAAATTTSVSLPLPAGTTYVSSTAPAGWTATPPTVGTNGTVTFTNPSFAVGSAMFTVVANVGCAVTGTLSATATSSSATTDPTPGNNMGAAMTAVTNAAPTVTCPSNVVTPADAGSCGAVVSFTTPTATDDTGCTATVVCAPASGSTFAIGTTTVTCTATDAANQTGMCSFTVTVNDTQAPTVTCPTDMTAIATGPAGVAVTYTTPTANDNCPGATVVCAPASGSTFPVGPTTVTCTATDASSNTGTCSFTVTVLQRDTIGLYVSATNAWFLRNTNTGGGADVAFTYGGSPSLVAIKGDWDNDGDDTPGLYDPATGNFFLRNSNSGGNGDIVFSFGAPNAGLVPLAGDWNNDGTDSIGLYDPATGNFFLKNTNAGGGADITFTFGAAGAGLVPVTGDWNADGTDSIGLYAPSTSVFFLKNVNSGGGADLVFSFGAAGGGLIPIAGDWDSDMTDTVGLYNPSTGAFFLKNTNADGGADLAFSFGPTGATPLAGNWDGL